jgi:hypothetical protein
VIPSDAARVDVSVCGVVLHSAATTVTARDNAGVNPVPDLLRSLADHIEKYRP